MTAQSTDIPFRLSAYPTTPLPSTLHILSLLPPSNAPTHPTENTTHIPLLDLATTDILSHIPTFLKLIEEHANNLLIHCSAGVSRAPTVACIWEIAQQRAKSAAEAIENVRKYRPQCDPNEGFVKQLQIFAENREMMMEGKCDGKWFLDRQQSEEESQDTTKQGEALPAEQFKCAACRKKLKNDYQLTRHSDRCNIWFMEEPWFSTLQVFEGKIHCENCNAKIGHWAWKGIQCNCGQYVVPGFGIQTAKVDIQR